LIQVFLNWNNYQDLAEILRMKALLLCLGLLGQTPINQLQSIAHSDRGRIIERIRTDHKILVVFVPKRRKPATEQIAILNQGIDPKIQEDAALLWALERSFLYPGKFVAPKKAEEQPLILLEEDASNGTLYHVFLHYLQWKDGSLTQLANRQKELTEKFDDWVDSKKAYEAEPNDAPIKKKREMGMFHTGLKYFILRLSYVSDDSEWKKDVLLFSNQCPLHLEKQDLAQILERLERNHERRKEDLDLIQNENTLLACTSAQVRDGLNCPDIEKYCEDLQEVLKAANEVLESQKNYLERVKADSAKEEKK